MARQLTPHTQNNIMQIRLTWRVKCLLRQKALKSWPFINYITQLVYRCVFFLNGGSRWKARRSTNNQIDPLGTNFYGNLDHSFWNMFPWTKEIHKGKVWHDYCAKRSLESIRIFLWGTQISLLNSKLTTVKNVCGTGKNCQTMTVKDHKL